MIISEQDQDENGPSVFDSDAEQRTASAATANPEMMPTEAD